jgi:hypothetical protein
VSKGKKAITKEDIIRYNVANNLEKNENGVHLMFTHYDHNKDSTLDLEEFKMLVKCWSEKGVWDRVKNRSDLPPTDNIFRAFAKLLKAEYAF